MNIKLIVSILAVIMALPVSLGNCEEKTKNEMPEEVRNVFCPEAWAVFSNEQSAKPAPNIDLVLLQYYNENDRCVRNINNDVIKLMTIDVQKAAGQALATSKSEFEVMVRFTLTQKEQPIVDVRYRDADNDAYKLIESFHSRLKTLNNYHSESGTAYVVFQYKIEKSKQ